MERQRDKSGRFLPDEMMQPLVWLPAIVDEPEPEPVPIDAVTLQVGDEQVVLIGLPKESK